MDPPSFSPPAQPPAVVSADPYAGRSSRFGSHAEPEVKEPPRDLAVVPISYEHVVETPASIEIPSAAEPPHSLPPLTAAVEPYRPTPPAAFQLAPPPTGPVAGETYVTRDGDSWWSLAESAYGDGRLYRALYAWNRSLNERVSLVPGTNLDIPPEAKLGAAWSTLLPTD
jgi:nucleoid-associated protein YgaU